ncbi:MAG: hypothetical protein V7651_08945 [Hyphomonas oceanitis]|uniref:hypothetical protein n=1 Tax=Hyphomonas oceanitis TaxID=81033 RepID=UPI0030015652
MSSKSYPSTIALLGLAAVAGYANRKKLGRLFSTMKDEADRHNLTGENSVLGRLSDSVRDSIRSDDTSARKTSTGQVPPAPTGAA